jgi:hypothetical protein
VCAVYTVRGTRYAVHYSLSVECEGMYTCAVQCTVCKVLYSISERVHETSMYVSKNIARRQPQPQPQIFFVSTVLVLYYSTFQ